MRIQTKMLLLVLPLLITPLMILGIVSSLAARNGISQVAVAFLRFKAEEIKKYSLQQWNILEENNISNDAYFIDFAKKAVAGFAMGSVREPTELILAVGPSSTLDIRTADIELSPPEITTLQRLVSAHQEGWLRIKLGGVQRVAIATYIKPFDWYLLVTEKEKTFYSAVEEIVRRTIMLIAITTAISTVLLILFSRYLIQPMKRLERIMTTVMETNDLELRAGILYNDEIGSLSSSFNSMAAALNEAYAQIKNYALETALSQRSERKVRNIFQKYVPASVIEQFINRPESQLIGDERILSILFSDIIGFSGISERLKPSEVVDSLNHYFERMVNIIMQNTGIVDKYIGDAIMAFFGAPLSSGRDSFNSVTAGLEMTEAMDAFNVWQEAHGRPPFRSGIGINYGKVTIGNIGSDKKMDYTIIGDMVNISSRIEGLTRIYKEPILISDSVYQEVHNDYPCRFIDKVVVLGKSTTTSVYSVRRHIDSVQEKSWAAYHLGLGYYYDQHFEEALGHFAKALSIQPEDIVTERFAARCGIYIKTPPGPLWSGAISMSEK